MLVKGATVGPTMPQDYPSWIWWLIHIRVNWYHGYLTKYISFIIFVCSKRMFFVVGTYFCYRANTNTHTRSAPLAASLVLLDETGGGGDTKYFLLSLQCSAYFYYAVDVPGFLGRPVVLIPYAEIIVISPVDCESTQIYIVSDNCTNAIMRQGNCHKKASSMSNVNSCCDMLPGEVASRFASPICQHMCLHRACKVDYCWQS